MRGKKMTSERVGRNGRSSGSGLSTSLCFSCIPCVGGSILGTASDSMESKVEHRHRS
jgi:hypothetical protein